MMEGNEFLTLENEALSVRILPGLGGKITSLRLKENDFEKISKKLGKSIKSIDNAMQRVKRKVIDYLWK